MNPTFFKSPKEFRAWLGENHATATELWVGFYKKGSGRPSITWPESVDEALCFGWIDGLRKSLDEASYMIRFTPRKSRSVWSAVNMKRAEELIRLGRMRPVGLQAYEARTENRSGVYSYEQRPVELVEPYAAQFRRNREAWRFFRAQPPSYRKVATWFVLSAKKEETRLKRLAKLIDDSSQGRRITESTPKKASK